MQPLGVSRQDAAVTILFGPFQKLQNGPPLAFTTVNPTPMGNLDRQTQRPLRNRTVSGLFLSPANASAYLVLLSTFSQSASNLPFKKFPQIKYFPINLRHKLLFFFSCFQSKTFLSHFHTSGTPTGGGIVRKRCFPIPPHFFFFELRNSSIPGYNDQLTLLSCNLKTTSV